MNDLMHIFFAPFIYSDLYGVYFYPIVLCLIAMFIASFAFAGIFRKINIITISLVAISILIVCGYPIDAVKQGNINKEIKYLQDEYSAPNSEFVLRQKSLLEDHKASINKGYLNQTEYMHLIINIAKLYQDTLEEQRSPQ